MLCLRKDFGSADPWTRILQTSKRNRSAEPKYQRIARDVAAALDVAACRVDDVLDVRLKLDALRELRLISGLKVRLGFSEPHSRAAEVVQGARTVRSKRGRRPRRPSRCCGRKVPPSHAGRR